MSKKPTYEELEQRNRALEKETEKFSKVDGAFIESELKCQVMMRSLPTIVYKGFKDWSVEFTDNKVEALTGYSCEEFNLKKLKWSDIILKEDIEAAKESFIMALKNRDSFARDYRVRTESPPAKRVGSGGPPEGGDDIGKAPLGLSIHHRNLNPIVPVHSFLVLECICVWFLHLTQQY